MDIIKNIFLLFFQGFCGTSSKICMDAVTWKRETLQISNLLLNAMFSIVIHNILNLNLILVNVILYLYIQEIMNKSY